MHGHQCCRHAQNQRIQYGLHFDYRAPENGIDMPGGGVNVVLNGLIDLGKVQAWNVTVSPNSDAARIIFDASHPPSPERTVSSDCDAEMLFYVPFTELVRIRGIVVVGDGAGRGPSAINIYANMSEVPRGFDSVQRLVPQESLELVDTSDDDEILYILDAGKFLSVGALALYVTRSFGGDVSVLRKILFFGESTRLPTHRPAVAGVVYEARGNPADHPEVRDERKRDAGRLIL